MLRPPRSRIALVSLAVLAIACGGSTATPSGPAASSSVRASTEPSGNPSVKAGDVTYLAKDGTTWALRHAPDVPATEKGDAKSGATSLEHFAADGATLGSYPLADELVPLGSTFTGVFEEGDKIYVASRFLGGFRLASWSGEADAKVTKVEGPWTTVAFADASGALWSSAPRGPGSNADAAAGATVYRTKVDGTALSTTALPRRTSVDAIHAMAMRPKGGACVVTTRGDLAGLDASGALAFVAPLRERLTGVSAIDDVCFAITEHGVARVALDGTVKRLDLPLIGNATIQPGERGAVVIADGNLTATATFATDPPSVSRVEPTNLRRYKGFADNRAPYAIATEVTGASLRARRLKTAPTSMGPLTASSDGKSALYADGYEALVAIGADGKEKRTPLTGDKPTLWTAKSQPRRSVVRDLGGAGWLAFDFENPVPTGTATHMSIFRLEGAKRREVAGDLSYYDFAIAELGASVAVASYGHGPVGFVGPDAVGDLPFAAGVIAMRGFGDELVFATDASVYRAKLGAEPEQLATGYFIVGMDAPSRDSIWASVSSALLAIEDGHARLTTAPIMGAVAVRGADDVWVGGSEGITHFDGKRWARVPGAPIEIASIVAVGGRVFYATKPTSGDGEIGVVDEDVRDLVSAASETSTTTIHAPAAITPADATGVTLSAAKIPVAGGPDLALACLARPLHGRTGTWVVDEHRAVSLEGAKAKALGPADCRDGLIPAELEGRVTDAWGVDIDPTGIAWFAKRGVAPIASRAADGVVTWFPNAPRSDLDAVDATRADRTWFAGGIGQGELTRFDGTSFVTTFTPHALRAVASFGDDVWAVGDFGEIVHARGTDTPTVVDVGTSHLRAVLALGANDVWAAGTGATLLHFDGSAWTRVPSPGIDAKTAWVTLFAWDGRVHVGGLTSLYRVDR